MKRSLIRPAPAIRPRPAIRRTVTAVIAVAVLAGAGVVAAAQSGAAASMTTCAQAAGSATFTPGLYKLQKASDAKKHQVKSVITAKGNLSGCAGGPKSGTLSASIKIQQPTNCNGLLSSKQFSPPTVGPLTVKWNTGKTSTVGAAKLTKVSGQPYQVNVTGKVSAGFNAGKKLTTRLLFKPVPDTQCTSAPLTRVTFKAIAAFKIA